MPNPVKQSPITVLTSAEAAAGAVLAFLVAHGIIGADIAKSYGPYFVIVYVAAFGVAKWWNVMPWAKGKTLAEQLEAGGLHEADVARIEAMLDDVFGAHLGTTAPVTVGADHPDAETIPVENGASDDYQAGMSAGATA